MCRDNLNAFVNAPLFNQNEVDYTSTFKNEEFFCLDGETKYYWTDTSTFIAIVLGILSFFIVLGTFIDILRIGFDYYKNDVTKKSPSQTNLGLKLLLSFSLYTNLKAIMATNQQGSETLTCLNGMRFISMTWVVLGHNFAFIFNANINNFASLGSFYDGSLGIAFDAIMNAVPSVDSFFLMR